MDIKDSARAVVQVHKLRETCPHEQYLPLVDLAYDLASIALITTDTENLDALREGIVVDGHRVTGNWETKEVTVQRLDA